MAPELFVDLDEVCAEFMPKVVAAFGEPARWDTYILSKMYPDVLKQDLTDFVLKKETYQYLSVIPGAKETLMNLHHGVGLSIRYVTARPSDARDITMDWLRHNNFPNYNSLIITHGHDEKIDFIKDTEPWGVIEDRGSTLLSVIGYIQNGYLFDRPWNRGFNSLRRVISWNHLYNSILKDLQITK